MHIEITAPATTANLGPGFDCLGAALSIPLTVSVGTGVASGWQVADEFGDHDTLPSPSLILKAAARVAGDLPPLDMTMRLGIPVGRGLGSSAAAIAVGLLLGCALAGRHPRPDELLEIGLDLEGHPDNLAPCLYGGLVLVVPSSGSRKVMQFEPTPTIRPVVLVPADRLPTAEARQVLPRAVPFGDAVASTARASGLLALLAGAAEASPERLLACTEDVLHQPYRAGLAPRTALTVRELRSMGVAAVVSGAGPSILCLTQPDGPTPPPLDGWRRLDAMWDVRGAQAAVTGNG